MSFNFQNELNLTGSTGGYYNGYDLLNGANRNVGGFQISGTLIPRKDKGWGVSLAMFFNDILDMNDYYGQDVFFAWWAKTLRYNSKDNIIRLGGNYHFIYNGWGEIIR